MPNDNQKAPLSYELPPSSPVSRRQFRLLLALVLVNLLITLQFAYFPGLTASIKNRWAQYQQKREREAAVKQALAVEQQAMNFADPPDKVVWDENPETAAKLLAAGGYKSIPVAVHHRLRRGRPTRHDPRAVEERRDRRTQTNHRHDRRQTLVLERIDNAAGRAVTRRA